MSSAYVAETRASEVEYPSTQGCPTQNQKRTCHTERTKKAQPHTPWLGAKSLPLRRCRSRQGEISKRYGSRRGGKNQSPARSRESCSPSERPFRRRTMRNLRQCNSAGSRRTRICV